VLLDCVIYCAFYSILFRGAVFFRSRCRIWWRNILHRHFKTRHSFFRHNFPKYGGISV